MTCSVHDQRQPRCFALLLCTVLLLAGCTTSEQWVKVRDTPRNPLAGSLNLLSPNGPKPTERTTQLLRRYDLEKEWRGDRAELLARLDEIQRSEPNREHDYAMAEIAYITAAQKESLHRDEAIEFYGTALIHAYRYLFSAADELPVNAYDPQFRGASDLYNQALEGVLRHVRDAGSLKPGTRQTIKTANHTCGIDIVVHSTGWHEEDIDRFEFVSDYQVQGLRNHYHSYGLGVPLIAVRQTHEGEEPAEEFYPPNLCFPVTAVIRVNNPAYASSQPMTKANDGDITPLPAGEEAADPTAPKFVLDLYDPLDRETVDLAGREVPLEADLSTPLAYFLSQPQFQDNQLSTLGLLKPGDAKSLQGLYMLEPYDPHKMPVVMVHGLWSSPVTWMEMFNDLRSDPQVRENYQFWFYLYPTGQPFWFSAAQMREDIAEMRTTIDPSRSQPALDQMVLVGHSMGGLVSKLQSIDSEDDFWDTMSDHPFEELEVDPDVVESLAETFYFQPNPSVRRVVTIGTPHRGSEFANDFTRWFSRKLISLPDRMTAGRHQLLAQRDFFRPGAPLDVRTSIDSLAPGSPLLPVLLEAEPGPWVAYHNIAGQVQELGWRGLLVDEGDGVVSLDSARLDDMPQLRSQIIVPSDHVSVHRHPQSILEVRRVLLEQMVELQNFPAIFDPNVLPASATEPDDRLTPLP